MTPTCMLSYRAIARSTVFQPDYSAGGDQQPDNRTRFWIPNGLILEGSRDPVCNSGHRKEIPGAVKVIPWTTA